MMRKSRGFILAPVLWMVIFLAAVAGAGLRFMQSGAASSQTAADRFHLEDLVRSALALGVAEMDARRQAPQGRLEMRLADGGARLVWTSEASRVDLNLAGPDLLRGLFLASGSQPDDARDYVNKIMSRRASLRETGGALATAFAHPDEIAALRLPERVARRVRALSTVYGASGAIDPRLAPEALLGSLPGMTEILQRQLVVASDLELSAIKTREADGVGAMIDGRPALAVRFQIDAHLDSRNALRAEVVLVRFFDDAEPYRILYWANRREGDEG